MSVGVKVGGWVGCHMVGGSGGQIGQKSSHDENRRKNKGNQKYDFFHQNKVQLDNFCQKTGINCIFGLKSSKK